MKNSELRYKTSEGDRIMSILDKIKNPVFLKEESEAEKQFAALQELKEQLSGEGLEKIEQEINRVEAGIFGEKQIHFELENSHIPMFVLHDLFLEDEGLKAQIDYLVLTRKNVYVIECKNLYGNIEINNSGSFIRSYQYKGKTFKEGIYSPITQNERHIELIKAIRGKTKNILTKVLFEKYFDENYHPIVVLANPKTVLNDKYAKKEIKEKVIRGDQLVAYIKEKDADKKEEMFSEKEMEETANYFLALNKTNPVDYAEKFRKLVEEQSINSKTSDEQKIDEIPSCPKCGAPMILRTATKGENKGSQFWGCSKFPKCRGIRQL